MSSNFGKRSILVVLGIALGIGGTLGVRYIKDKYYVRIVGKIKRMSAEAKGVEDWDSHPNFKLESFATGFDLPTRIVFPPPEVSATTGVFCYVSELPGRIKCIKDNGEIVTIVEGLLNFERKPADELGLVGMDLHPDGVHMFATMSYWDEDAGVYRNKVDRFQLGSDGVSVVDTKTILDIDSEPTVASYQIMFAKFSPEGTLYVGVGSGGQKSDCIDLDKFAGKIIRMDADGNSLPDNPFYDADAPQSARSYVYAYGVRNPYDIAWYPSTNEAFVSEVGPGIDRITRLEKGLNYCFAGGPLGDETMRSNALYTFGPGGNFGPTGVTVIDNKHFGLEGGLSLLVGVFGPVHTAGAGDGKCIHRFDVAPTGHISSAISDVVRYKGDYFSSVTDVEVGPDKMVYFADPYGDGDSPHANKGIIYRLVRGDGKPKAADVAASPGEALFKKYACASCHDLHVGTSKKEGPSLGNLYDRLMGRLDDDAYDALLDEYSKKEGAYFVRQREKYEALKNLEGEQRIRQWFFYHVRDPRFDHPTGKMPSNGFINDEELQVLADYLLAE